MIPLGIKSWDSGYLTVHIIKKSAGSRVFSFSGVNPSLVIKEALTVENFKLKLTLSLLIVIWPTLALSSSPTAVSTPTPAYTIMIQKQVRGNPVPPPTFLVTAHHTQSPCNLCECAFGSVCLFKMGVLYHMCGSLSFLSVRHWPDVACLVVDWGYNAELTYMP